MTNTTSGGSRAKTGIPVSFVRFTLFVVTVVNVELIERFKVYQSVGLSVQLSERSFRSSDQFENFSRTFFAMENFLEYVSSFV